MGTIHTNNNGEEFEIIGKTKRTDRRMIKFKDRFQYIGEVTIANILMGTVRNPNCPSVFGVGYIGEKHNTKHPLYKTWKNMLARCYYKQSINYKNYGAKGVTVDENWHCFSTFIDDVIYSGRIKGGELLEQIRLVKNYDGIKFELDKDISGKNIYSVDTVTVVTKQENISEMYSRKNK